MKEHYCNCEADCIHKSKKFKKIKVWQNGETRKRKIQVCKNKKSCTCGFQTNNICKAFLY